MNNSVYLLLILQQYEVYMVMYAYLINTMLSVSMWIVLNEANGCTVGTKVVSNLIVSTEEV